MIKFHQPEADLTVPGNGSWTEAAARITHLGIGAHQDDLEFMAYHGILECYDADDKAFGGVICTNGAGSSRTGSYENCADEDLRRIRRREQIAAAEVGRYAAIVQLDHPTAELKNGGMAALQADLGALFRAVTPQVVYTHNPADKHDTHLFVTVAVLRALRDLPRERRPRRVLGCEVWRGLDWVNDDEKVLLDVSGRPHLAAALNGLFDSQIAGGKRYDLATEGRRRANATYLTAHACDDATHLSYALDLTPLMQDDSVDILEYTVGYVDRFRGAVESGLRRALGH